LKQCGEEEKPLENVEFWGEWRALMESGWGIWRCIIASSVFLP
jgi:uncharacterized membrane protein (DUF2068 family)